MPQDPEAAIRQTYEHIHLVQKLLASAQMELMRRQFTHDRSKLANPEWEYYQRVSHNLEGLTYGSPEYTAQLKENLGPAIEHHYAHNRHHPEWVESQEEWRAVVGYEGLYEVSSLGQVRSLDRVSKRDSARGDLFTKGCVRKPHLTPKGYLRLQLVRDGVCKNHLVHRLVADAFLEKSVDGEKIEVNHKDGDKQNNEIKNLEWLTGKENLQHSYDCGMRDAVQLKYVVHCVELDITTYGATKMEAELKDRGYKDARASSILACMHGDCTHHMGLTFEGEKIEQPRGFSYVNNMNLFDLLEMICDWLAATKRHADGDIEKSIEINTARFNLSPQLVSILRNTVTWVEDEFSGLETQKDLRP